MIGTKYPSELRDYTDPKSGLKIRQLTTKGINYHLYFTENSFDSGDCSIIYFLSDRAYPDTHAINVFRMDTRTGEMEQVTDYPQGIGRATKTPDSEYLLYNVGNDLHLLHTPSGVSKCIYSDPNMLVGSASISADKRRIGFVRTENIPLSDTHENYRGFTENMYAIKDCRVAVMNIDGTDCHDVFQDTHWVGHFQFSPDDPSIAMFCHEGPWNYVQQRIWIVNMDTGFVRPCFRQEQDDSVGHEFWTRDGMIVFDNRRRGHDGTITSDKTQAVAADPTSTAPDQMPYFGFADKTGNVYRTIQMPYYCNHYHANSACTWFVGDAVEDLVMITVDGSGDTNLRVLANHNTTWRFQRGHCHPTVSWDDTRILYAADTDAEHDNIFLIDLRANGLA